MSLNTKFIKEPSSASILRNSEKQKTSVDQDMFERRSVPPTSSKMASLFCWIAVPAVTTNIMAMIAPFTNAIFAGRMNDPTKLAAVGLANVILMLMI